MEKCEVSSVSLTFFGNDALAGATRSLDLIQKIEQTIATLCYDQSMFGNIGKYARIAADSIAKSGASLPLDPGETIGANLLVTQGKLEDIYKSYCGSLQAARDDNRLTSDDGVADEYIRAIEVIKGAHNAINDLRWAILEHDADLDKHTGPAISDGEELRKYLATI